MSKELSELICLKCYYRWVELYDVSLTLRKMRCTNCGDVGYIIKTGQTIPESAYCKICVHYYDNKCKLNLNYNEDYGCGYYRERK